MTYPNTSILMGAGQDDAWFIVRGRGALLVSTNGAAIINGIQERLLAIIDQANGIYGSSDSWREQFGGWNGNNWSSQTGRWDATTARAVMLIADVTRNAFDPKTLRYGWADYYAHRWGRALTQLALRIWMTNRELRQQILNVDVVASPLVRQGEEGVAFDTAPYLDVVVPNEAIFPRWNVRPPGYPSPITVRSLTAAKPDAWLDAMTPPERRAYDAMTPGERMRFDSMTPEQRQAARDLMPPE